MARIESCLRQQSGIGLKLVKEQSGNTTAEKGTLQRATEHDKLRDGAGYQ